MAYIATDYATNPKVPLGNWTCAPTSRLKPFAQALTGDDTKGTDLCGQCVSYVTGRIDRGLRGILALCDGGGLTRGASMHRLIVPIILVALSAASASMAAETYQLEKTHVDLLFSINHAGFTEKHGLFRELDATLQYDAQNPENSQVTVTVKTDSLDTSSPARDKDVKGEKFLDVAKYPEMRFVSTKVASGAEHALRIDGDLTLHGITKPLTLYARLNKAAPNPFDKKPTLGFTATGSLKRSDFGIKTYVPMIGDEVTITIDAEFNRTP